MYASANSCVDRLNTEGGRDPASRLAQIADNRWAKAGKVEEAEERDTRRPSAQPANGRWNLSAWTLGSWNYCWLGHRIAADKHRPKGYQLRVPLKEIVPISVKDWQLKLLLKEMPDFTVNERQLRKRCQICMWQSKTCLFFQQRSIQTKLRCINTIQGWLHWIYQCYDSLVSRLFLVPSWQRVGEQDWRLPVPVVGWRLLALPFCKFKW